MESTRDHRGHSSLEPTGEGDLAIADANEAACRKLGYAREELVGGSIADLDAAEPSEPEKKQFGRLMLGISRDMLREGVELKPSGGNQAGIRIRLKGKDLEIDLRDRVLSDLLLGCLTPRYRAIAEGME